MADAVSPHTPKKLFKASTKTKTPTPIKRPQSRESASPKNQSKESTPEAAVRTFAQSAGQVPKFVRKASSQAPQAALKRIPAADDIAESTTLAPLTNASDVASGKLRDYAASDTTGETPIGLIDNDILTPTDTHSRSTDAAKEVSRRSSETMTGAGGRLPCRDASESASLDKVKEAAGDRGDGEEQLLGPQSTEAAGGSGVGLSDQATDPSVDLAKVFAEHGNPEMAEFVKALTAPLETETAQNFTEDVKGKAKDVIDDAAQKISEDTGNAGQDTTGHEIPVNADATKATSQVKDNLPSANGDQIPTDVEKSLANGGSKGPSTETTQTPEVSKITQQAKQLPEDVKAEAADLSGRVTQVPQIQNGLQGPSTAEARKSGATQAIDNMGKPAQINRSIEIPLPEPTKEEPIKSKPSDFADLSGVPGIDTLPNVNDVADPPEEILDPEIHSPSQEPAAQISPIPKVGKVEGISSRLPPDLFRLANGLGGNTVDDVGNIVDEAGKVLGHATGDLPAMMGKRVSSNGEIYGDGGELIGYVTENFTGHPPPSTEHSPLPGGLKVDREGNILDSEGRPIGKLNRPAENYSVGPYSGPPKAEGVKSESKQEEDKGGESKKFDTSGIPADIFLDVKSTPDGIQLTIRIPTVFKQETQQQKAP